MNYNPDLFPQTPTAPSEVPPEPEFVVEEVLTEDLYIRFNRIHLKATGMRRMFTIFGAVFIVIGLFGLLTKIFSEADGGDLFPIVWILILGLFLVVFMRFAPKISSRAMLKTAKGLIGRPYALWFYADKMVEYSPRGQKWYPFAELYKVVESDDLLLLYINRAQAHVFEKSYFRKGTPEALTAYLTEVCHVPYKRVR